jgi:hypothetical protein
MIFNKVANFSRPDSLSAKLREKRFSFFLSLLSQLEYPIIILDVGGTEAFWKMMNLSKVEGIKITLLNTDDSVVADPLFTYVKGDARDLKFPDKSFDVVFSNSVIEHVGGFVDQYKMAQEVRRVGKRYFIQTPNKNFPIEPHFVFPFFQFLPKEIRVWLLMNFKLGWFSRQSSPSHARSIVDSIFLLNKDEFLSFFPGCKLYQEKIAGITKSFIAYSGWE